MPLPTQPFERTRCPPHVASPDLAIPIKKEPLFAIRRPRAIRVPIWSEPVGTVIAMTRPTASGRTHRPEACAPHAPRPRAPAAVRSGCAWIVAIAAVLPLAGCTLAAGTVQSARSGTSAPPPGIELPPSTHPQHPGIPEPDPRLTPGAVLPTASAEQICRRGYARIERSVSVTLKRQVFRAYRTRYVPGRYEVDHLIPLELGGANLGRNRGTSRIVATANLWPEPRDSATVKDRLENRLHAEVCAGREPLRMAQRAIARDWYSAWLREGRP
jgi:hypothetical protein